MERYQNNLQDQFGNAIPTVTVTVRLVSDGSLATIFSDNSGTGKANPFTNDADGEFFFYAADDRYNIFFTGPITDQKDDVLLQDSLAISPNFRVFADIVTATPPTTEAVTANVEYADLDNSDFLARVGFQGSNTFRIKNLMHDGNVEITAEDAGGVDRFIMVGDPGGANIMYAAGIETFRAHTTGQVRIHADIETASPPVAEAVVARLDTVDITGTDFLFQMGFSGSNIWRCTNFMHGGDMEFICQDAAGLSQRWVFANPDAETNFYRPSAGGGSLRIATQLGGIAISGSVTTAAPPTTEAVDTTLHLFNLAGANRLGRIGYFSANTLFFQNEMHGGGITLRAQDGGGIERRLIDGVPGGALNLRYPATDLIRMQMAADGIVGLRSEGNTDTESRRIIFEHQDGVNRGAIGFYTSGDIVLDNNIHAGDILLRAEDTGGTPRTILLGNPDALTTLVADTDLHLDCNAGDNALIAIAAGKVGIYFNNVETFRTADRTASDGNSGAQVLDGEGVFRSVGYTSMNVSVLATTGTVTPFTQARARAMIKFTGASATNWDTFTDVETSQTDIEIGTIWMIQNDGAGTLTFRGGASVTIQFWDASGAPADADVTVARGGIAWVHKVADNVYAIWGFGLT